MTHPSMSSSLSLPYDVIIPEKEKIDNFLHKVTLDASVWVFDFNGTLAHKGCNSFAPIEKSHKDTEG